MYYTKQQILQFEKQTGLSQEQLIHYFAQKIAKHLETMDHQHILLCCGKGNNGKDCATIATYLTTKQARIIDIDRPLNQNDLNWADLIVDGIFGFSFHDHFDQDMRKKVQMIQAAQKPIFNIDLPSGAYCDDATSDKDVLHGELCYVLGAFKIHHAFQKVHQEYKQIYFIPFPNLTISSQNLDIQWFMNHYPSKAITAYKGQRGRISLITGSFGMAGASWYNILGATILGADYIQVCLPATIYPIVATKASHPVFYPCDEQTVISQIANATKHTKAIAFGSGANYFPKANVILDYLLQECHVPIVLDAFAFTLLHQNTYILNFKQSDVILTPHLHEFSMICRKPVEVIQKAPVQYACQFAKTYHVYLVLKGPNTIIADPNGEVIINQSGNPVLSYAGSGDLLTGMITAMLAIQSDPFLAIQMAVYMHGHLADLYVQHHSQAIFQAESFLPYMDELFHQYHK